MTRRWYVALVALLAAALCLAAAAAQAGKDEDEETVTYDQLPDAVKKTLDEQAQGGTIDEIEKETEDGKVVYEAEITKDGKTFEVEIAEDGTLLETEADGEDD